eukprot:Tbor_TRINITY_DN5010_c3_g1::TRINITY_DN5010_c3_g1_i2::g.14098::m.14098/K08504/BET1; blocked early in transport 1
MSSTLAQQRRPIQTSLATSSHLHKEDYNATEKENDAILKALMSDIQGVKATQKGVGVEIKRHLKILDVLSNSLLSAGGALRRTAGKLDGIGGFSAAKHMWLLIVFAFAVICFIILLLKFK